MEAVEEEGNGRRWRRGRKMREGIGPLPQILNTPMRFSVHNLLNTERHTTLKLCRRNQSRIYVVLYRKS